MKSAAYIGSSAFRFAVATLSATVSVHGSYTHQRCDLFAIQLSRSGKSANKVAVVTGPMDLALRNNLFIFLPVRIYTV